MGCGKRDQCPGPRVLSLRKVQSSLMGTSHTDAETVLVAWLRECVGVSGCPRPWLPPSFPAVAPSRPLRRGSYSVSRAVLLLTVIKL